MNEDLELLTVFKVRSCPQLIDTESKEEGEKNLRKISF
jgi:hypothetical protein